VAKSCTIKGIYQVNGMLEGVYYGEFTEKRQRNKLRGYELSNCLLLLHNPLSLTIAYVG